jgi:hypothetical protein
MFSENGVLVDCDEIARVIATADVFTLGFANFAERLVVDSRSNARETQMVVVAEPTAGARQRLSWLRRRRPSLGNPESFTFVAWPHSPAFLEQSGTWERICQRVGAEYDATVQTQCEIALKQLYNLDHEAVMAIMRGENCLTLWPRQPEDEDQRPS